jgi:hypothetical protein
VIKESSAIKGIWYIIKGQYIDFDGKVFGLGDITIKIKSFKGTKRLISLPCYLIKYYRDCKNIENNFINCGKKFITLVGIKYRLYIGLAFTKLDRKVIKISINSRVVVDLYTFRYSNPNYLVLDINFIDLKPFTGLYYYSDDEKCRGRN